MLNQLINHKTQQTNNRNPKNSINTDISTFGLDEFKTELTPNIGNISLPVGLVYFPIQLGNFKPVDSGAGWIFLTNLLTIYPISKVQLILKINILIG